MPIIGILLLEGDSHGLGTGRTACEIIVRPVRPRLVTPDARFVYIQHRFRIVREHRLVVRAFDGDGDGLFRPRAPVVHDADHKGLGHGLALAQCRDVIIAIVELIGIVPVLVQGQGPVLRGGDIPAVTTPGDLHRAAPQIMAAGVLPHRGGGQRRIIARALQGELQSVVVSVRGFLPRAVFPVVIRGLHTAGEPDHGIGRTIGRAVGMQPVVRHRYFLAGGIEELFAVKDVQRRPVIGAGHRDRHFLAGPGAMLVPDEDGEGLRQRLAFIEVVEPVVLRPVTGRKIAALVQRVGIAAVRSDGQAAVLPPDGDIAAVSGKVDAIRGFGLAGLHTVDEFRAVVGILARGLVAVRERTVIPADLVSSRPVLAGHVNELVIRPIDHGTVIMTAHAAFRDVQRAAIRTVTQLQTGLVVGPVDGDGDVGGNFLAEGILDRDGKGLGQHLALGQLVDGIAVLIKSAGLELIGIGTVCMEGQRTVAGFIDGIAVRRSGDQLGRLRLGHGRRTVRFQLGIRGIHTEGEIPLVAKVNVRGIDPARKALCLVMAGDDIALPVDDIPRLCRRIAVTAVMVDAFFLEDEIILVRDDRERARAFHLDDDLPGVVSTMLIHHGDLKGLEMGVLGIELLDELAPAVDHIGPAAVRIDGQSTVVGRENGLGAAFRADMPRLRLMPCGRRGRMLHVSIRMGTAGNKDGLVTARIGIDVPDIERSGKLGPARGVIDISGVALYGLEHRTVREDLSVAIPDLQRRLVIAARNGDGHGLQIPGAVLVLHIDGEGIRDGGPFRQGIDGGNVKGLAIKAGRPLHGFSLALQGIGPGAVAVQDQMAEAPFHGLAALHVAIRGILAQKDVCVRALRPFPAAVLALVTGHGTEPQLVPGIHVRAGHLAFQLLRALVISVRAVVGLVLFLRTRSSHHLTVIGTPHAALDEPQLGIRIQRDLRLVVGTGDGERDLLLLPGALVVLHEDGEAFRDSGPFRQVVQRRLTVEVPVQPLLEFFQAGVGRPVHRDREGQRNTVAVPVQRVGIGGRAVGRFRHDQLAVMPLGRDAGLAARGQLQAFGRRHAGTVRHGKVQDIAMIHVRSVDAACDRSGPCGIIVVGVVLFRLSGLVEGTVIGRRRIPAHTGLIQQAVRVAHGQRRSVIAARNGDGHGLQIPGAVLVLHIDGEGIRDGGPFRQGIDGGNVKGLAIKAGRPLHGFSLALQGIGPGAVAVQDQMAEAPFHGLAALHVAIRGILAQKDVCVRALRPFPAAVLALVTGHGTEPQLVPGIHVRAGHLAFQLLRALVISVRAVVGLVLFLRTRSSHHLTVIGTPHAALDEPQLGIRIQRDLRLVVGTGDGERDLLLLPGALVVLHEDGEAFRDSGPFRQVVQRRLTVEVPVQPLLEFFQAGVGRPVHRDREGQRNTVAVPVQRVGIGGRAVGRFRHDQLAVMPLGRDAGLAARGQLQAFGRRHAGTVRHGKVQDIAMIHVRSVDAACDRSGPCGIIVVGVVLFRLSGLVEGTVIGRRRIPAHTGLIQQAVRVAHGQRRSVIAARNGDGHGLQIPGAVLVLHIDGEGIRDGGPFRQGIDGGNVKGLAIKAGRPLHGFSLALQGIGPGAVAVQDQMAEAPFHGLAALHVAIRGILAQKDVCVRALRPFPAAVLALVTGHGTEPQLVPGIHVRAGHLAFQLLRALVISVRAVVGLVLFLRTRSSHHLTVIGTPHAALDEPQLGIRIQRDLRLVVGPLDGHGERGLGLAALPVLHAHGEVLTHGLAQGQAVGIGVIVVQGIGDDTGVGIDGDDAILGDDAVAAVGKAVGQPPAVRIAGHHLPHDDRHTGGEDIALDLLAPVGLHTGFHQGHVVTVHSDDAADLGIEVLVRPAADLIVGPLHAIAKTDVQTPQMIDAVQQVAATVFVIAAAARGTAAGGRTGGGHQVFTKGREEILPADLHPFHLEGGHLFLGIRGVEALQPDGRPIFKAQDKIVAIAGQRCRIRRKIEDEAPVRSAGDGLCGTSNRLGKTDIGHEGPPDKKSCDLSKKYENVKSPVPKGLGTGLGFARHARGASGVRQGEGIKKSCHAR